MKTHLQQAAHRRQSAVTALATRTATAVLAGLVAAIAIGQGGRVWGEAAAPTTADRRPTTQPTTQPSDTPLPTGRWLDAHSPDASVDVGSLPVNLIATPDGRFAVSTDEGFRESIWSIGTADGKGIGHVDFRSNRGNASNGLYFGLAASPTGTIYAAEGAADRIAVLKIDRDGQLELNHTLATHEGDFPAGLALDARGMLYVTNNDPDRLSTAAGRKANAFGVPASVAIYDTRTEKEVGRFAFQTENGLSNYPLALTAMPDGSKVYVASQRDATVYVLAAADSAAPKQLTAIQTGSHPVALAMNQSHARLFVANAHSDTISVVDTATDKVTATVLLRPEIAQDLAGATPLGLAISPDEKTLYAALADMNAVAVIDIADPDKASLTGYLAAGWYPTAVVASPDGKRLLVANAKGNLARHPNMVGKTGNSSPLSLLEGTVTTINLPPAAKLPELTRDVLENARLTPRYLKDNPLKEISLTSGKPRRIEHVIYIVKENRTYDQVLGDLPQGNGDPSRCLFGREVTPNLHALAERFVLLDNFYDSGEVSGDGWNWSTEAHANEYIQRNVPYNYSSRGRHYDFEGEVGGYPAGGFPAKGPDGKPLSEDPRFKEGAKPINDVGAAPGGHLWDMVRKQGVSYRNYGFFVGDGIQEKGKPVFPDNYPSVIGVQPPGHDLEGITDVDFRRFDLEFPDSDAPAAYAAKFNDEGYLRSRRNYGRAGTTSRFAEWDREFQMMLKKAPGGQAVPAFMTVRFGVDHTVGANPGKPTPRSMVADNDYAVGQLVDAISHSPIWKSTAIFVIEDDAQNGPDHVDAHRSICFVISPWIKKASIDHSFQNTVSVIKTMELLLGLPPMCQFDAASGAILDWSTEPSNDAPFEAIPADPKLILQRNGAFNKVQPVSPALPDKGVPTTEPAAAPAGKNPGPQSRSGASREESLRAHLAARSAAMDFTHADRAPAAELNDIIWKTVKGVDSSMPATPTGPLPVVAPGKAPKKDDDD